MKHYEHDGERISARWVARNMGRVVGAQLFLDKYRQVCRPRFAIGGWVVGLRYYPTKVEMIKGALYGDECGYEDVYLQPVTSGSIPALLVSPWPTLRALRVPLAEAGALLLKSPPVPTVFNNMSLDEAREYREMLRAEAAAQPRVNGRFVKDVK